LSVANVTIERRGRKGRKGTPYFSAAFAAFAFQGVGQADTLLEEVMKPMILAVTVFGVTAIGAERSVWTGVFSEAQVQRGAAIYNRECSTCHGEKLKGAEGAPALTGPDFLASWNNRTVGDLFDRIRQTMPAPPEQPGKLTPQQNADVVACILSENGFPAGAAELPSDLALLKQIRIDPKP
jgi:S-disulfanyl-L-cysteine oxidoreductase SoxD